MFKIAVLLTCCITACTVAQAESVATQDLFACDPDCDTAALEQVSGAASRYAASFIGYTASTICGTDAGSADGGNAVAWCDIALTRNGQTISAGCSVGYWSNGRIATQLQCEHD